MSVDALVRQLVCIDDEVLVSAATEILRLFFGRVTKLSARLFVLSRQGESPSRPGVKAPKVSATESGVFTSDGIRDPEAELPACWPADLPLEFRSNTSPDLWHFYLKDGVPTAVVEDLTTACRRCDESLIVEEASTAPVLSTGREEGESRDRAILLRRVAKVVFYRFCRDRSGRSYPWGSLTGIRPTYIATEVLARVQGREDRAKEILQTDYDVASAKADLAVRVARAEAVILDRLPPNSYCLYIGIPFCPSKCHYCSFTLAEGIARADEVKEAYVEALIGEMQAVLPYLKGRPAAIYIGGGTPGDLPAAQIEKLLSALHGLLPAIRQDKLELCFEAGRPDVVTEEKLRTILAGGVNRLCLNPQTMQDTTLNRIGRRHTVADFFAAFKLARELGFKSINMDLIAGLPGETVEEFDDSLQQIAALRPDSLTVHALAVKRSSDLKASLKTGQTDGLAVFKDPDTVVAEMLSHAVTYAADHHLQPYYLYRQKDGMGGLENIGFAHSGAENLYNVAMMSDRCPVIGFGCGAMSKAIGPDGKAVRSPNVKSLSAYLARSREMAGRKLDLFTL